MYVVLIAPLPLAAPQVPAPDAVHVHVHDEMPVAMVSVNVAFTAVEGPRFVTTTEYVTVAPATRVPE